MICTSIITSLEFHVVLALVEWSVEGRGRFEKSISKLTIHRALVGPASNPAKSAQRVDRFIFQPRHERSQRNQTPKVAIIFPNLLASLPIHDNECSFQICYISSKKTERMTTNAQSSRLLVKHESSPPLSAAVCFSI